MAASVFEESGAGLALDPVSLIRLRALADVKRLRALARTARLDGLPQAELRAAHAKAAARSVAAYARRMSSLCLPLSAPAEIAAE